MRCGNIDVDMLASDDGSHAWGPDFGPRPTRPVRVRCHAASCCGFQGSIWRIWLFRVLCLPWRRIGPGPTFAFAPGFRGNPWSSNLASFESVIPWPADMLPF